MGAGRGMRIWGLAGVTAVAACTAVANGRLDGLPSEGRGGAGGAMTTDGVGGEGNTSRPSLRPVGTGCTNPDECASGFCVDDVCCDQKCEGECLACDVFQQNGVCQALVGDACTTVENGVCTADGMCVEVDDGTCTSPSDCQSNFCVDGRCCNEACDGPCQTCRDHTGDQASIPDGICAYQESDDAQCSGQMCVGKGQCCGEAAPPTGDGVNSCPAACTGGCTADTCIIACDANACKAQNIICPPDFDCQILCIGHHACQDSSIDCPANHDCALDCDNTSDKNHACERVTFTCTNGPCNIVCAGKEPCPETIVNCGSNACSASCNLSEGGPPSLNCGDSCGCDGTCP